MPGKFIPSNQNRKDEEGGKTLRPQNFSSFLGQTKVKERLKEYVNAARSHDEPLGHLLLSGPPGLGKATLAYIIANEKGCAIKTVSGPVIDKPGDLADLLTSLKEGDILFIDEIHRLNTAVVECLFSAIKDYFIDIMIDKDHGMHSARLKIPRFTLIGSTIRQGRLSTLLQSLFSLLLQLDYYSLEDLQQIIQRSGNILNVKIEQGGAYEIARRSHGTPRIANNLLHWIRDHASVQDQGVVTQETASNSLDMLDIDDCGLDEMDKRILKMIMEHILGGPVGLNSLSVAVGEEADTIEDIYEPYLIQEGYLMRTSQGCIATEKAWKWLGRTPPEENEKHEGTKDV